jgi:hypothetical protein
MNMIMDVGQVIMRNHVDADAADANALAIKKKPVFQISFLKWQMKPGCAY